MPALSLPKSVTGARGGTGQPVCMLCPNDLMVLDKATMKAHNRDPWMCWGVSLLW